MARFFANKTLTPIAPPATCNMQLCSLGLPLSNSQIDISSYVTSMFDKAVLLVIGIVSREDLSDKFVSLASSTYFM